MKHFTLAYYYRTCFSKTAVISLTPSSISFALSKTSKILDVSDFGQNTGDLAFLGNIVFSKIRFIQSSCMEKQLTLNASFPDFF